MASTKTNNSFSTRHCNTTIIIIRPWWDPPPPPFHWPYQNFIPQGKRKGRFHKIWKIYTAWIILKYEKKLFFGCKITIRLNLFMKQSVFQNICMNWWTHFCSVSFNRNDKYSIFFPNVHYIYFNIYFSKRKIPTEYDSISTFFQNTRLPPLSDLKREIISSE